MSEQCEQVDVLRDFAVSDDPTVEVRMRSERNKRRITIEWNDCIYDERAIVHPEIGDATALDGRIADINRFVSEQIRKAGEK